MAELGGRWICCHFRWSMVEAHSRDHLRRGHLGRQTVQHSKYCQWIQLRPLLKGGKDGRSLPCSSTASCTSISKQREIFLTPLQCIQRKSRDCSETHSEWDWQLLGGGSLPEQKRRSGVWFSLWYYFHSGTQKEESTTLWTPLFLQVHQSYRLSSFKDFGILHSSNRLNLQHLCCCRGSQW